MKKRKR